VRVRLYKSPRAAVSSYTLCHTWLTHTQTDREEKEGELLTNYTIS